MTINCPNCKLSKDIGAVRIPRAGMTATCPRCRTVFEVKPESRPGRWRKPLILLGIVLCAVIALLLYDWKLDENYFLQPGSWQGEMTFRGKQYPFVLVIEKAQDGRLEGYMDWLESNPRYRLAIRGTYVGNHLVFKDYEFVERKGSTGLNDEKDVYIIGNEMSGTDKNGIAAFHALKRGSQP